MPPLLALMPHPKSPVWPWRFWCPFQIFALVLYLGKSALRKNGLALKLKKKFIHAYINFDYVQSVTASNNGQVGRKNQLEL